MSPVSAFALLWVVIAGCLAMSAGLGVWLVHARVTSAPGARATELLCVSVALLAFFATGFAFAMGGVRGDMGALGAATGLGREWAPGGPGRGLLGLEGFFLSGFGNDPTVYGLFAFHATLLLIAAVIAIVPWAQQAPRVVAVLYSVLFGGVFYALFANWVWGGGWLAGLGQVSGLGHGVIDVAGSGVVNATAGLAAIGALAALRPPLAEHAAAETDGGGRRAIGLGLAALGWIGLITINAYALANAQPAAAAANPLVAFVCATAVGLLYSWFAAGEPDLTIGVCSGLAGLAAIAGGAPFYPTWAAAIVGGVAGLLAPLAGYLLGRGLRQGSAVLLATAHAVGGLWGLLAVGLLADGSFGAGINGVGVREYLARAGQGVTGLWPAAAVTADPGQLKAQVTGCAVLLAFAGVTWLIVRIGRRVGGSPTRPSAEPVLDSVSQDGV